MTAVATRSLVIYTEEDDTEDLTAVRIPIGTHVNVIPDGEQYIIGNRDITFNTDAVLFNKYFEVRW